VIYRAPAAAAVADYALHRPGGFGLEMIFRPTTKSWPLRQTRLWQTRRERRKSAARLPVLRPILRPSRMQRYCTSSLSSIGMVTMKPCAALWRE
jgi:hypothetical protein